MPRKPAIGLHLAAVGWLALVYHTLALVALVVVLVYMAGNGVAGLPAECVRSVSGVAVH